METKKMTDKTAWIVFGIGAIVFTTLLIFAANYQSPKTFPREEGTHIVFMGDSNIAFQRDETDIPELVAEKTGAITYNCAIGGTSAARINPSRNFDYYMDLCCLPNLVDIILTGDMQNFNDSRERVKEFSEVAYDRVKQLSDMDFRRVDYLFIAYGLNDYTTGLAIDDESDRYNQNTYCGSIRLAIKKLKEKYPDLQIILCSITYCWRYDDEHNVISGFNYNYGGGTIDAYCKALMDVSTEYEDVYFLDNLELLGINNENYPEYLTDEMHVNGIGQELWAQNAADLILTLERENEDTENGKDEN